MNQDDLREFERRCVQDQPPGCEARCPIHFNVREFIRLMAEGEYAKARSFIDRLLPIPGILARICDHPCENECLRRELGGAVAIGDLERACLEKVKEGVKSPTRPKKAQQAAVLGSGISGLTAAWDLTGKGFPVTIFFSDDDREAALTRLLERSLPARGLRPEAVLPSVVIDEEFERLAQRGATFTKNAITRSFIKECQEKFDGVFIDAGSFPEFCPPAGAANPITGSMDDFSLCFGGWGDSIIGQAFDGRRAATTMERVMGKKSPDSSREGEGVQPTCLYTPLDKVAASPRLLAENGLFSDADARAEAARCIQCECMACVRQCVYMQHFKQYPKAYARSIFLNVTMIKGHRMANPLLEACCLCRQCEVICPNDFSMADLCLLARREMLAKHKLAQSAYEFALLDMAQSNAEQCRLARPAPGKESCTRVFFPGCQLAASRGGQVMEVFRHLRANCDPGMGIWLGCCGIPAHWSGHEKLFEDGMARFREIWTGLGKPEIVAACSSCMEALRLGAPDIAVVSLWEVLDKEAPPPPAAGIDRKLTVNDPCTSRFDENWRAAVRSLLRRRGVEYDEPEFTGEKTSCCGYGGLVWNSNPRVADDMAKHRAGELANDAVSSCIMCRDRLAAQDKASWHLLDVLWPDSGVEPNAPGPGLSARRFNRAALKKRILKDFYGAGPEETKPSARMNLIIADAVLKRAEAHLILAEDIEKVVRSAEDGGQKFLDRQSGHLLAAKRLGTVTFWVEYDGSAEEGYVIHDAYSHRMTVPGKSTEA